MDSSQSFGYNVNLPPPSSLYASPKSSQDVQDSPLQNAANANVPHTGDHAEYPDPVSGFRNLDARRRKQPLRPLGSSEYAFGAANPREAETLRPRYQQQIYGPPAVTVDGQQADFPAKSNPYHHSNQVSSQPLDPRSRITADNTSYLVSPYAHSPLADIPSVQVSQRSLVNAGESQSEHRVASNPLANSPDLVKANVASSPGHRYPTAVLNAPTGHGTKRAFSDENHSEDEYLNSQDKQKIIEFSRRYVQSVFRKDLDQLPYAQVKRIQDNLEKHATKLKLNGREDYLPNFKTYQKNRSRKIPHSRDLESKDLTDSSKKQKVSSMSRGRIRKAAASITPGYSSTGQDASGIRQNIGSIQTQASSKNASDLGDSGRMQDDTGESVQVPALRSSKHSRVTKSLNNHLGSEQTMGEAGELFTPSNERKGRTIEKAPTNRLIHQDRDAVHKARPSVVRFLTGDTETSVQNSRKHLAEDMEPSTRKRPRMEHESGDRSDKLVSSRHPLSSGRSGDAKPSTQCSEDNGGSVSFGLEAQQSTSTQATNSTQEVQRKNTNEDQRLSSSLFEQDNMSEDRQSTSSPSEEVNTNDHQQAPSSPSAVESLADQITLPNLFTPGNHVPLWYLDMTKEWAERNLIFPNETGLGYYPENNGSILEAKFFTHSLRTKEELDSFMESIGSGDLVVNRALDRHIDDFLVQIAFEDPDSHIHRGRRGEELKMSTLDPDTEGGYYVLGYNKLVDPEYWTEWAAVKRKQYFTYYMKFKCPYEAWSWCPQLSLLRDPSAVSPKKFAFLDGIPFYDDDRRLITDESWKANWDRFVDDGRVWMDLGIRNDGVWFLCFYKGVR